MKNKPGPARRLKRPNRITTTRSQSMQTWMLNSAASPTMTATTMPAKSSPPRIAVHMPKTAAAAANAITTLNKTAPLRVAFFVGSDR